MSAEEQNHNQDTNTQSGSWGAFSAFKKSGNTATNKGFSSLTKLLIFLTPALLFATFYQYSVVKGSTFLGISLRHNVDLERGLVGHWTFDGADVTDKVYDMSGEGNHGGFVGGATTSAKAIGKVGQAMEFDGVDDHVVIDFNSSLDITGALTLSAWVNPSNLEQPPWYRSIVQKGGINTGSAYVQYSMYIVSGQWPSFTISNGSTQISVGSDQVFLNEWYHLVGTYDGSANLKFYLNGVQVDELNSPGFGPINSVWGVDISYSNNSPDQVFAGKIDDVRIYNRSLSAKEVEALYKQGEGSKISVTPPTIPALEDGLVSHLTFDGPDTTSATATDVSGNGNDGEISGATTGIGKLGQSLQFDGVDDEVVLLIDTEDTQTVTTSFWLYVDSYVDGLNVLTYRNEFHAYTPIQIVPSTDAGTCDAGTTEFRIQGNWSNNTKCYNRPSAGEWHHYVGVFDLSQSNGADEVNFYLDGVLQTHVWQNFGGDNLNSFTIEDPVYLMSYLGIDAFLQGRMDDVRIYNRALTATEITQLYNLGEGTKFNVTPPTAPALENGLVSHLTFDGPDTTSATATDVSGNGNDGEIYQAKPTIGKIGQAFQFDGVNDEVSINTISGMTGATDVPFSWSFWVNSSYDVDEIIGWGSGRRCRLTNVNANLGIGCTLSGDEYLPSAVNSTTLISDSEWHHVVYTHNSGVQRLYVDGQLEDTGSEGFSTGSAGINLATRPFGSYFGGKIDDFRMYNRAITANEVAQLYNLGR